jgi:hypothetical protein
VKRVGLLALKNSRGRLLGKDRLELAPPGAVLDETQFYLKEVSSAREPKAVATELWIRAPLRWRVQWFRSAPHAVAKTAVYRTIRETKAWPHGEFPAFWNSATCRRGLRKK